MSDNKTLDFTTPITTELSDEKLRALIAQGYISLFGLQLHLQIQLTEEAQQELAEQVKIQQAAPGAQQFRKRFGIPEPTPDKYQRLNEQVHKPLDKFLKDFGFPDGVTHTHSCKVEKFVRQLLLALLSENFSLARQQLGQLEQLRDEVATNRTEA